MTSFEALHHQMDCITIDTVRLFTSRQVFFHPINDGRYPFLGRIVVFCSISLLTTPPRCSNAHGQWSGVPQQQSLHLRRPLWSRGRPAQLHEKRNSYVPDRKEVESLVSESSPHETPSRGNACGSIRTLFTSSGPCKPVLDELKSHKSKRRHTGDGPVQLAEHRSRRNLKIQIDQNVQ